MYGEKVTPANCQDADSSNAQSDTDGDDDDDGCCQACWISIHER